MLNMQLNKEKYTEREKELDREWERESVLGKAILSGNNIIQSVCML